jgi:hypothetical protein
MLYFQRVREYFIPSEQQSDLLQVAVRLFSKSFLCDFADHIGFGLLQPQIHFLTQTPKQEPSNMYETGEGTQLRFPLASTGVQDKKVIYTVIILNTTLFHF